MSAPPEDKKERNRPLGRAHGRRRQLLLATEASASCSAHQVFACCLCQQYKQVGELQCPRQSLLAAYASHAKPRNGQYSIEDSAAAERCGNTAQCAMLKPKRKAVLPSLLHICVRAGRARRTKCLVGGHPACASAHWVPAHLSLKTTHLPNLTSPVSRTRVQKLLHP